MNTNFAGFGRRLVATILDGIILSVVGTLVGSLIGVFVQAGGGNIGTGMTLSQIVSFVLGVFYIIVYQAKAGQTLGKKVMGVKVVDYQGKTPTMLTFFLREYIGKLVSAIILLIGFLMILWDGKKQGLHDKIASTYVVRV